MSIRTDGVRILDVYAILNPGKLKGVNLSQGGDAQRPAQ
jgi:hypothetical protein